MKATAMIAPMYTQESGLVHIKPAQVIPVIHEFILKSFIIEYRDNAQNKSIKAVSIPLTENITDLASNSINVPKKTAGKNSEFLKLRSKDFKK
jgi:hypothetical protein